MRVADIMTSPVISVAPSTTIGQAAQLMLAHRISGLPVTNEDGTLVGIVSEGDFLRRREIGTDARPSGWLSFFTSAGKAADDYVHAYSQRVGDVMTTKVLTAAKTTGLNEIVETMSKRRIKRLPVLEDGKLIGIVARSDLMRALASQMTASGNAAGSDDEIRAGVLAELARNFWSGRGLIRVNVQDGNVELSGTIFDERERLAAQVAAETVPGVRKVVDQLVCIEPISGTLLFPPRDESVPPDATKIA